MTSPAPKPGRWIAKPRKPRWSLPLLGWSGLLAQLVVQLPGMVRGTHLLWLTVLAWAIPAALLGFIFVPAMRGLLARRKTEADRALVDGGFGEQYPVEVTVVVEGKRIGADRGVVWFADGLMGFSGEASSFVLAPYDLAPQWIKVKRQPTRGPLPNDAIVLRGAPKTAYLTVGPLLGHGRAYRRRFREFVFGGGGTEAERLARFVQRDEASAERFWPPLERYEAAR